MIVLTTDPKLFNILINIVVKQPDGQYRISIKDLCKTLSLDISRVNEFLELHYASLRKYPPTPHYELPPIGKQNDCLYIISDKEYCYTDEDKYCVTPYSTIALLYAFIDMIEFGIINTKYDVQFFDIVTKTITDSFIYASEYEKINSPQEKESFWKRLFDIIIPKDPNNPV